jgi:ribosome biogenesis GTPase
MAKRPRPNQSDLSRAMDVDLDAESDDAGADHAALDGRQQFNKRSKFNQQMKTARTAAMRLADADVSGDIDALPVGQVVQVHSLFCDVEMPGEAGPLAGRLKQCVIRKTLQKVSDTRVVVGDRVRVRLVETAEPGAPEGVVEQVLPRDTLLTRADSFKALESAPVVANAGQMLIVASLWAPFARWGLIDRMLIAAEAGRLRPVVCLNKWDFADDPEDEIRAQREQADAAIAHYESLGVRCLRTSVTRSLGLDDVRALLRDQVTVLAGHSGVGKSSLITAVQPDLDLRVGEVSAVHLKGKHTTTSARRYDLAGGGSVIDTPGVKLFGLWGVTRDNLDDFFPDVTSDTAPPWRVESYQRIKKSIGQARQ